MEVQELSVQVVSEGVCSCPETTPRKSKDCGKQVSVTSGTSKTFGLSVVSETIRNFRKTYNFTFCFHMRKLSETFLLEIRS